MSFLILLLVNKTSFIPFLLKEYQTHNASMKLLMETNDFSRMINNQYLCLLTLVYNKKINYCILHQFESEIYQYVLLAIYSVYWQKIIEGLPSEDCY